MRVFVVQHEYEWCGHDEVKLIGACATRADAEAAVERVREAPGFRDWPEGFTIDPYEVGVDDWAEGFVILVNILVPSKPLARTCQAATSVWRPGDLYEISDLDEPKRAAFSVGDVVRCEERPVEGHGNSALVATEVLKDDA